MGVAVDVVLEFPSLPGRHGFPAGSMRYCLPDRHLKQPTQECAVRADPLARRTGTAAPYDAPLRFHLFLDSLLRGLPVRTTPDHGTRPPADGEESGASCHSDEPRYTG